MGKGKIVTSAPYFQVCKKCGRHGRFVIPSHDLYSREILTKQDGVESANHAFSSGLIKKDELPELVRQINTSIILPEKSPDINIILCKNFIIIRYEEIKLEENASGIQETDSTPVGRPTLH